MTVHKSSKKQTPSVGIQNDCEGVPTSDGVLPLDCRKPVSRVLARRDTIQESRYNRSSGGDRFADHDTWRFMLSVSMVDGFESVSKGAPPVST